MMNQTTSIFYNFYMEWISTCVAHVFPLLNLPIFLSSFLLFSSIVLSFYYFYCYVQRKYRKSSTAFLFKHSNNEYECRELAFSTANYIHAILSSAGSIYVFYHDYFGNEMFKNEIFKDSREFNFFFSYTDNISFLMSFTLGYLCVDLICYVFVVVLHNSNTLNAVFHLVIVMAFSLFFVNG